MQALDEHKRQSRFSPSRSISSFINKFFDDWFRPRVCTKRSHHLRQCVVAYVPYIYARIMHNYTLLYIIHLFVGLRMYIWLQQYELTKQ